MRKSSRSSAYAIGLLAFGATACGVFGSDDAAEAPPPQGEIQQRPDAPLPVAPPVGGPANPSELTNAFGVFVATSGNDSADGSREHPLARIQAGIDLAKRLGKRVYVCGGTYREALVVASSISVISGLDCAGGDWRVGGSRARVESPTSPAIQARDLTAPTRIESLDVVAPPATDPGASSVALLASNATALVVASSKLTASDGAKGADGTDGAQLTDAATASGARSVPAQSCSQRFNIDAVSCINLYKPPPTPGGTNVCAGAPGIVAQAGGIGGAAGAWEPYQPPPIFVAGMPVQGPRAFRFFQQNASLDATPGSVLTGAAGVDGSPGANAGAIGTLSREGYVAAEGTRGNDGTTGSGGSGGSGGKPEGIPPAASANGEKWFGNAGASGGAGGCPGLAGTPGKGGGASIAALLDASEVTFDGTELVAGRGGDAGLGSFGSEPTAGGAPGANDAALGFTAAQLGGRGGAAGVSGNGSAGPSLGVAHVGPAPKVVGATKIVPGAGGALVAERSRTDALGTTTTVPATAAGVSKEVLAF